jgi:hypothetical protein
MRRIITDSFEQRSERRKKIPFTRDKSAAAGMLERGGDIAREKCLFIFSSSPLE